MNVARYSKAVGLLIVGALAWWNDIIGGPSAITASERHRLGALVGGVVLVYVLRNDPAPAPGRPPFEEAPPAPVG